ncbi:MAG: dynamin family protein [Desulfitobacteriaceae bacterium]
MARYEKAKEKFEKSGNYPKFNPKAAELRASIEYLVVRIPANVLRTITLVDTPGLNSIYDYHTKATQVFLQKADDVIWLF